MLAKSSALAVKQVFVETRSYKQLKPTLLLKLLKNPIYRITQHNVQIDELSLMITHSIFPRVRYAETDRMGYVYYGNYAAYFEVARVETLRSCGITYKSLEDEGILLPVVDFSVRYFAPAHYDDEIRITCAITEMPTARIRFQYQTHRGDVLLNEGETDLVFVNAQSGKPMRCPAHVLQKLNTLFEEN